MANWRIRFLMSRTHYMTPERIILPDLPEILEESEELPTYSEVLEHSNKWNTHPPTYEYVMQDHKNK